MPPAFSIPGRPAGGDALPRATLAGVFGIGAPELVLILVVALLVFGPKRLPELARTLGRGVAEFRRTSNELRRSMDEAADAARIEPPELEAARGRPGPTESTLPGPPRSAEPKAPETPRAESSQPDEAGARTGAAGTKRPDAGDE